MKPLVTVNDRPGATVLTLDSAGKIVSRHVVQARIADRETIRLALALAGIIAGIAITLLLL